jgi:hypothetical protein
VERHRVDEVDLVAETGQPERVGSSPAPDVQDGGRGRREVAKHELAGPLALQGEVAFLEARGLLTAAVEGLDVVVDHHGPLRRLYAASGIMVP